MNVFKVRLSATILSIGFVLAMKSIVVADLVGHWKFDGNLTDSIAGNSGTAVGDAVAGTNNGQIGGAVSFDGDADAVLISPEVIPSAVFSIAF